MPFTEEDCSEDRGTFLLEIFQKASLAKMMKDNRMFHLLFHFGHLLEEESLQIIET